MQTPHTSSPRCWLCGAGAWTIVLQTDGDRLLRCNRCRLVITDGDLPLDSLYGADYYSAHTLADRLHSKSFRDRMMDRAYATYLAPHASLGARLAFRPVRNRLGGLPPLRRTGGVLLDAGCGDGDFLLRARAAGYTVVGQEINPAAVASAKAAGLTVHLGNLEEVPIAPHSVDVLRMWHVLEHVSTPVGLLRAAHRLLKADGMLVVGVPNFDSPVRRLFGPRWSGLQLPFHRQHFTTSTLRRTIGQGGFRVDAIRFRSVGTLYSSLAAQRRGGLIGGAPTWLLGLLFDNLLDVIRLGDTLELMATPR